MRKAVVIGLLLLGAGAAKAWAGVSEDRLWQAVTSHEREAAKALLARHADPNLPLPDKSTILAWAVNHQDEETVRLLLKAGAKPNVADIDGATPFLLACELGDPAIVDDLLKAGADAKATRPDGISALALCARASGPEALEHLIAEGADVNSANPEGQTPLMWAACEGPDREHGRAHQARRQRQRGHPQGLDPADLCPEKPGRGRAVRACSRRRRRPCRVA